MSGGRERAEEERGVGGGGEAVRGTARGREREKGGGRTGKEERER